MGVFLDGSQDYNTLLNQYIEIDYNSKKNLQKVGDTFYLLASDTNGLNLYTSTDAENWTPILITAPASGSWDEKNSLHVISSTEIYVVVLRVATDNKRYINVVKYNGSTWTATELSYLGYRPDWLHSVIDSSKNITIFYTLFGSGYKIYHTKFTSSSSTFSSNTEIAISGTLNGSRVHDVCIDSNNVIHITAWYYISTTRYIKYNYGSYGSWNGWETIESNATNVYEDSSITADSNNEVWIAVKALTYVKVYNGTSGSFSSNTIETWSSTVNVDICIFANGTDIHLVYKKFLNYYDLYMQYAYYTNGTWSDVITLFSVINADAYDDDTYSISFFANDNEVLYLNTNVDINKLRSVYKLEINYPIVHTFNIELLVDTSLETAESGTTTTNVKVTAHNMRVNDFVVNIDRRSTEQNQAERGCRRITEIVDNDNFTVTAITGQTSGDLIRFYKFTDISEYILLNSIKLTLVAETEDEFTFKMHLPTSASGMLVDLTPYVGQYVRAKIDDSYYFIGEISTIDYELMNNLSELAFTIQCRTLKNRASKRTVILNYAKNTTSKSIVEDMIDYLVEEGIEAGTIETGVSLDEAWTNDCISIQEVIDELCTKNEFQWNIDIDFKLNFYQEKTVTNAPRNLLVGGNFTDFRNVKIKSDVNEIQNKVFFFGGTDSSGNNVYTVQGDSTNQNSAQNKSCGSGIYGIIERNSSIIDKIDYTALSGTTTTNLKVTNIGTVVQVGDMLRNRTRLTNMFVTAIVDDDNITVTTVASQTTNDKIVYYPSANLICRNLLKRQASYPYQITFDTYFTEFFPQQKIVVDLPIIDLVDKSFNIEKVEITDAGGGFFNCNVTAVERDSNNFSTQRRRNSTADFFKKF